MVELFAEYPEKNVKHVKLGIERVKDIRYKLNYNLPAVHYSITDIRFNYKFSDIKSINIIIKNESCYAEIYVNGSNGQIPLGKTKFDEKFDFDKVMNGTIKVIPDYSILFMDIFTYIFFNEYEQNEYEELDYKPVELKKLLRLYNEFLVHEMDYKRFYNLASYCEDIIHDKRIGPYPKIETSYCNLESNMLDGLHKYTKDITEAWDNLPKRYKPIKYKTVDDINNLIKDFANALREAYSNKVEQYKKYITDIDKYLCLYTS